MPCVILDGELSLNVNLDGDVSLNLTDSGEFGTYYEVSTQQYEEYTGSYTVTPSNVQQVLSTEEMVLTDNITIEPIPSNYGLITYNGSFLTVS